MRIIIAVITLLTAVFSVSHSQEWKTVASPFTETITGICALSPDTLFIVTGKGNIARTTDGGKNWKAISVAPNVPLEDISFADAKVGVVCGRNGAIYRTTDGGGTWENCSWWDKTPWLMDVEMLTPEVGVIIGMTRNTVSPLKGICLRTTDGGKTWKQQTSLGLGYSELLYHPGEGLYLLSFGKLHFSRDLGKTWESRNTADGLVARTFSLKGKTGIMAGPSGMFAYSSDSGKTWIKPEQWSNTLYITSELVDEKEGYIAGKDALIMRTTDGGKTWKREPLEEKEFDILDMCLAGDYLFAVGSKGKILVKKAK